MFFLSEHNGQGQQGFLTRQKKQQIKIINLLKENEQSITNPEGTESYTKSLSLYWLRSLYSIMKQYISINTNTIYILTTNTAYIYTIQYITL